MNAPLWQRNTLADTRMRRVFLANHKSMSFGRWRPWIEILPGTHRTSETSSEPSGSANPCLSAGVLGGSIRYGKTALDEPARVKSEWKSTA